MILRCTKKLYKVVQPGPALEVPAGPNDWYADLLRIDRFDCVLLVHRATMFPIFEPDLNLAQLRAPRWLVSEVIPRELASEQLPPRALGAVPVYTGAEEEQWDGALKVYLTADPEMLRAMADLAALCKQAVLRCGGVMWLDVPEVNRMLRRRVIGARSATGDSTPLELTQDWLRRD